MTDRSPEEEELFREARAAFSPTQERVNGVRGALATRIGAIAAGTGAGAAASESTAASAAGTGTGTAAITTTASLTVMQWIGIGALAVVVAGGAFVGLVDTRDEQPTRSSSATTSTAASAGTSTHTASNSQATATATRAPAHAEARVAAPPAAQPRSAAQPTPVATPAPVAAAQGVTEAVRATAPRAPARRAKRAAVPAAQAEETAAQKTALQKTEAPAVAKTKEPADPVQVEALAQEIDVLRRARGALDGKQLGESLALLDRYAALFPRGALRQEALAMRVLALCESRRVVEAKATAEQLERLAPRSAHLMRLARSCAFEDDSTE